MFQRTPSAVDTRGNVDIDPDWFAELGPGWQKDDGVPTAIYYPQSLNTMKAFEPLNPAGGMPVAERLASRVLSLPLHPYMTDAQANYVCDRFLAAVERRND